jgi:chromosome segregation ATPase
MPARSLTERIDSWAPKLVERRRLEQKVGNLESLPDRVAAVESQILQLRSELRVEFSAIRQHLDHHDKRFAQVDRRFDQVDRRFDQVDQRFDQVDQRFDQLENHIREGDEETRHQMRMLHEEVINRIALLQEHRGRRPR